MYDTKYVHSLCRSKRHRLRVRLVDVDPAWTTATCGLFFSHFGATKVKIQAGIVEGMSDGRASLTTTEDL